jgi:uncharacterized membrane protein (DUF485 family)
MSRKHYDHIRDNPDFHDLIRQKSRLSWTLSVLILLVYYSFILIIAFAPETLGEPISAGSTATWGILLGLGVILFTFLITGIYVHRANTIYDNLLNNVINASENHVNGLNQDGDDK